MSLDDALLNHVYKYWRPPLRRVPPLLWTRIRAEVSHVCKPLVQCLNHLYLLEATVEFLRALGR